jgi:hypothetical protein
VRLRHEDRRFDTLAEVLGAIAQGLSGTAGGLPPVAR